MYIAVSIFFIAVSHETTVNSNNSHKWQKIKENELHYVHIIILEKLEYVIYSRQLYIM